MPITVLFPSVQLSDLYTVEANDRVWMSECRCSHIRAAGVGSHSPGQPHLQEGLSHDAPGALDLSPRHTDLSSPWEPACEEDVVVSGSRMESKVVWFFLHRDGSAKQEAVSVRGGKVQKVCLGMERLQGPGLPAHGGAV